MKSNPDIKQEADRCVMCGLCLPHCPTYIKTENENESPRGRISLMRALATGELELTDKLQEHLDNCLLCRACEAKCPSKVNYGKMMDATRIAIAEEKPKSSTTLIPLEELATNKKRRDNANRLFWLADKTGIRTLGKGLGITKALGLERLEQLAPKLHLTKQWQSYYPATIEKRGDVALFTGCFSDMFDQETLEASIKLLNRIGYGVHVPNTQNCCGALHYHKGEKGEAEKLAKQNIEAFSELNIEAIINTASGCGSHLKDYSQLISEGDKVGLLVQDISEFLATVEWPDDIQFKPLNKRVAVHEPCSLRNVLKASAYPYQLLQQIPQIEVISLPGNERCCGAAGNYMIEHPEMADSLRQDKLDAITESKAEILVTSNIGCSMHIQAGLRRTPNKTKALHPITLLAQQLT